MVAPKLTRQSQNGISAWLVLMALFNFINFFAFLLIKSGLGGRLFGKLLLG
ncbi:MAG TPA: hypothetical protein VIP46_17840 [Pyrinomonadaceae bacterium]